MIGEDEQKTRTQHYVWLHPPPNTELTIQDKLFVLSDVKSKEEYKSLATGKNDG